MFLDYQIEEVLVLTGQILQFENSVLLVVEGKHLQLPAAHLGEVTLHPGDFTDGLILRKEGC